MMVYGNIFCCLVMLLCFAALGILDCKFGVKASIIKKLKKAHELVDK